MRTRGKDPRYAREETVDDTKRDEGQNPSFDRNEERKRESLSAEGEEKKKRIKSDPSATELANHRDTSNSPSKDDPPYVSKTRHDVPRGIELKAVVPKSDEWFEWRSRKATVTASKIDKLVGIGFVDREISHIGCPRDRSYLQIKINYEKLCDPNLDTFRGNWYTERGEFYEGVSSFSEITTEIFPFHLFPAENDHLISSLPLAGVPGYPGEGTRCHGTSFFRLAEYRSRVVGCDSGRSDRRRYRM
jgi:hypothetical protein